MVRYGARNHLVGTVRRVRRGSVMSQVELDIPARSVITAVMTVDSLDEAGIKEGEQVRVIIKAENVLLVKE